MFPIPQPNIITIYSKSGCNNCLKVKSLLKDKHINFEVVDCDEFLYENKDEFLNFIYQLTEKEYRTFPMVFDGHKFIGGYTETVIYSEELLTKLLDFETSF